LKSSCHPCEDHRSYIVCGYTRMLHHGIWLITEIIKYHDLREKHLVWTPTHGCDMNQMRSHCNPTILLLTDIKVLVQLRPSEFAYTLCTGIDGLVLMPAQHTQTWIPNIWRPDEFISSSQWYRTSIERTLRCHNQSYCLIEVVLPNIRINRGGGHYATSQNVPG
jgi:hypothetical protein